MSGFAIILQRTTTLLAAIAFLTATNVLCYEQQAAITTATTEEETDNKHGNDENFLASVIVPRSTHRDVVINNFTSWESTTSSSYGPSTTVYLVVTNQEWSVVVPSSSSSLDDVEHKNKPQRNRSRRRRNRRLVPTAQQAKANHCDVVATNGGPFNKDGTSSGPFVSKGKLQTNQTQSSYVGMGITMPQPEPSLLLDGFHDTEQQPQPQQYWVMGTYSQVIERLQQQPALPSLWEFVTGFQWLVYNGTAVADNSNNPTGANQAARTVMGLDRNFNLFMLVSDGCERCFRSDKRGLTLEGLAHTLVQDVGAQYAINMDGGGSSTMIRGIHYKVTNRPTCLDVPVKCQRPVATVLCVSSIHPLTMDAARTKTKSGSPSSFSKKGAEDHAGEEDGGD